MKAYRKLLQKIVKIKTKVLCALREVGVREAEDILQIPAKEPGASRCESCVGCFTLKSEGACTLCPACRKEDECEEHTRLCFAWRQPATTFVAGSVVMGVSSLCVIADYELRRYRELLEQLGDASIEIEATLDEFPRGASEHLNDRYNASRRTRDIQIEEEQFVVIETLVLRYQDERVQLDDVLSDDEEAEDVVPEQQTGRQRQVWPDESHPHPLPVHASRSSYPGSNPSRG